MCVKMEAQGATMEPQGHPKCQRDTTRPTPLVPHLTLCVFCFRHHTHGHGRNHHRPTSSSRGHMHSGRWPTRVSTHAYRLTIRVALACCTSPLHKPRRSVHRVGGTSFATSASTRRPAAWTSPLRKFVHTVLATPRAGLSATTVT